MRIAFDHQIFALQRYGGISRYLSRVVEELIYAGEDPRVFAPFHRSGYLAQLPKGTVRGQEFPRFPAKTTRAFLALNQLASAPGMRRWRPHVVHETYYTRASSRVKGAALILTVHDMIHEICRADFAANDPTSATKRLAVSRADHIICVSNSTRRDLIAHFDVPEHRTSVVHLGVDLPIEGDGAPIAPVVEGRPFLLFVGIRAGYKNFDGFLHAVADSSTLRGALDVVAFGGGAFTRKETTLIESLGMSDRVTHTSGDDKMLAAHYAQAAGLVCPSRYEGFGLPPLEAMAHGCPVICSDVSSLPEVVGDAAELFDPRDRAAMAAAIERVVTSSSRRHALIDRGYRRARALTWERCARETLAVYQSVVGGS